MQAALEPYGLEVTQAENGAVAVERAMASGWDLIFLDVVMPVMDGPTALRQLRARGNTTPVVLVTSVSTAAVVAAAVKLGGGLTGMVNNAGIYTPKPLMETDAALFERHMRVNQLGCFLGMQAVVPAMERSGGGSIVNISSTAGLRGSPGAIAYSGTKWALRGMTKAAAVDLAPRGIRVNSVHPGPIDTDMVKVWSNEQRATRLSQIPIGRIGEADDVARAVLFLLSEESSYMTGAELAVDGGASL
jgi:3alpha(or 20beta)-hydroxysteroid dehydrogenase